MLVCKWHDHSRVRKNVNLLVVVIVLTSDTSVVVLRLHALTHAPDLSGEPVSLGIRRREVMECDYLLCNPVVLQVSGEPETGDAVLEYSPDSVE